VIPSRLPMRSNESGPLRSSPHARMVKVGRVYDLAPDLNSSVPQGPPGAFPPFSFRWAHVPVRDAADEEYQFAAETISGTPHVSTHIAKP
jgi:hypothetical protein